MSKEEVLEGLESLIEDRKSLMDDEDEDCPFAYDIEVLKEAKRIVWEVIK